MRVALQRLGRSVIVVALAVAINFATVEAIAFLNGIAHERSEAVAEAHRVVSLPPPHVPEEEPAPEEEVPEEEVVSLELDAPEFLPISDFSADTLDLELPEIPTVHAAVAVHSRMAVVPRTAVTAAPKGPMRSDRVDTPPRELASNPRPSYPRTALRKKLEGKVVCELLIDEEGRVREVKFIEGDALFVRAVSDVIERWRFTAPMHEGKPLKVRGRKTFTFTNPNRRSP